MTIHLTEDQVSRWFAGRPTEEERRHLQHCSDCAEEVDRFANLMASFRSAVLIRADHMANQRTPSLAGILNRDNVANSAPTLFSSLETSGEFPGYRWISVFIHGAVLALLLLASAVRNPLPSTETLVALYKNSIPLILNFPISDRSGSGGGGGGMRAPTPPSKGEAPQTDDKQLLPPMVEAKNLAPALAVEPTVVAPQRETAQLFTFPIGDPNGVVGPSSAGPGRGGGIGTGDGTGIGPGDGPGIGPGSGGGRGRPGIVYSIGGSVTAPRLVHDVLPDYSDDARKARIQGSVELRVIVREDGSVLVDSIQKGLGFGLDQKAIDAVLQWRFQPGRKDGQPIATYVSVFVNFTIR